MLSTAKFDHFIRNNTCNIGKQAKEKKHLDESIYLTSGFHYFSFINTLSLHWWSYESLENGAVIRPHCWGCYANLFQHCDVSLNNLDGDELVWYQVFELKSNPIHQNRKNPGKALYRIELSKLHSFIFLKSDCMFYSLQFIEAKNTLVGRGEASVVRIPTATEVFLCSRNRRIFADVIVYIFLY